MTPPSLLFARALSTTLLGAIAVAGPVACGRDDLVVAELTASPDAGAASLGDPCASDSDCPSDAYCEKPSCSALTGTCQISPPLCDSAPDAVCGCDGITYWNDCYRQQHDTARSANGVCHEGLDCNVTACPASDARCAHFVGGAHDCDDHPPGTCWILPDECVSSEDDPPDFRPCDLDGSSACVSSCQAILAGTTVIHDSTCH